MYKLAGIIPIIGIVIAAVCFTSPSWDHGKGASLYTKQGGMFMVSEKLSDSQARWALEQLLDERRKEIFEELGAAVPEHGSEKAW